MDISWSFRWLGTIEIWSFFSVLSYVVFVLLLSIFFELVNQWLVSYLIFVEVFIHQHVKHVCWLLLLRFLIGWCIENVSHVLRSYLLNVFHRLNSIFNLSRFALLYLSLIVASVVLIRLTTSTWRNCIKKIVAISLVIAIDKMGMVGCLLQQVGLHLLNLKLVLLTELIEADDLTDLAFHRLILLVGLCLIRNIWHSKSFDLTLLLLKSTSKLINTVLKILRNDHVNASYLRELTVVRALYLLLRKLDVLHVVLVDKLRLHSLVIFVLYSILNISLHVGWVMHLVNHLSILDLVSLV